jgi:hypothetical protein
MEQIKIIRDNKTLIKVACNLLEAMPEMLVKGCSIRELIVELTEALAELEQPKQSLESWLIKGGELGGKATSEQTGIQKVSNECISTPIEQPTVNEDKPNLISVVDFLINTKALTYKEQAEGLLLLFSQVKPSVDNLIEALEFAYVYIQYVKEKNLALHLEANGTPDIEKWILNILQPSEGK